MDYVDVVAEATDQGRRASRRRLRRRGGRSAGRLGLRPAEGLVLKADFGVTHGGPDGQRTRLRTYWNNQHTGIVDDAVFELKMTPRNWGQIEFKP